MPIDDVRPKDVGAGQEEAGQDLFESETRHQKPPSANAQKARSSLLSENASKRLWMGIAGLLLIINIASPIVLIQLLRKDQLVIAIDGADTFHIGPGADFEQSEQLMTTHGVLAALTLLQRSAVGFDLPEMLQQLFTAEAKAKATAQLEEVLEELKSKNERWRPEIAKVEMVSIEADKLFALRVTGQLIKNGVAAGQPYEVPYNFTLLLRFVRNPRLMQNARYPLVVYDFEIRIERRPDGAKGNGATADPGQRSGSESPASKLLNDVRQNQQR